MILVLCCVALCPLTNLSRMELSFLINWTSLFPFQGLPVVFFFHFHSNCKRTSCKQIYGPTYTFVHQRLVLIAYAQKHPQHVCAESPVSWLLDNTINTKMSLVGSFMF